MNIKKIDIAEQEARRFLERIANMKTEYAKKPSNHGYVGFSKEAGALRRSSMDLTRALADMRKY